MNDHHSSLEIAIAAAVATGSGWLVQLLHDPTVALALHAVLVALTTLVVTFLQAAARRIQKSNAEVIRAATPATGNPSVPPRQQGFATLGSLVAAMCVVLLLGIFALATESCTPAEVQAESQTLRAIINIANGTCAIEPVIAGAASFALDAGTDSPP